jgi:hypothetical protein
MKSEVALEYVVTFGLRIRYTEAWPYTAVSQRSKT